MKRKGKVVGLAIIGAVCVGVFYAVTKKNQPTEIKNQQKATEELEAVERKLEELEKEADKESETFVENDTTVIYENRWGNEVAAGLEEE